LIEFALLRAWQISLLLVLWLLLLLLLLLLLCCSAVPGLGKLMQEVCMPCKNFV
jgi:uncharacterized SAM-binding protein YcdF (DUF218 family)